MADIDIDPFERHDRTESRTDETGENIPIPPVTPVGIQLGNQNSNKKHHLEESLKELNS